MLRYPSAVIAKKNRRWVYGIFALAAAYFIAFYAVPIFLDRSEGKPASANCIPQHGVGIDHGVHHGHPWRITASVEKNPGCSFWMLKVDVSPEAKTKGSWTGGWGIPAGGHLPAAATIGAGDYPEETGRAVGGVVGTRVQTVLLKLSGGRKVVVHPKRPSIELRERFVWLHGLGYFLRFYPSDERVRSATLLDAAGKVITTVASREGHLEGFMGVA